MDVILHILRRCPASIRHQHLWFGLSLGRAEQHNTDNVEPERNEPYIRNHVCSFISTPLASLKLHILLVTARVPSISNIVPYPQNSFQSHRVFLFVRATPSIFSSHRAQSCPALEGQTLSARHRHPRLSLGFRTASSVARSICTFSQA